ncbi:MAG: aspartate-semialdehyde dehydrogenase [Candidatus Glassbacteria bacterium]
MKVAVVGATGLVGSTLVRLLDENEILSRNLTLVASARSAGTIFSASGESRPVLDIGSRWHVNQDLVFLMAGRNISRREIPQLRDKVPLIIDNSSAFRMEPDVPLVVPQVNPEAARQHSGLIANPNCSTIQLVVAVNPIHKLSPVTRIHVSTYQAASGAGKEFMERFWKEAREDVKLEPREISGRSETLSFNLLPVIDTILEDGYTREEEKIMEETRKILSDESIHVSATAIRVPVVNAHSESVYLETVDGLDIECVKSALSQAPGVRFVEDYNNPPTPRQVSGSGDVFVSRLRKDRDRENAIHMWVVADNLRKGAALNALEIAKLFMQEC